MQKGRLPVLDGLRGLAILLVVMTHSFLTGYRPALSAGPFSIGVEPLVLGGSLGVELFFFLSGFVLFVPYARSRIAGAASPGLSHFFSGRALKIVPSYVIALFVLGLFFYQPPYVLQNLWRDIALHLIFIHTFYYTAMFSIASPFWSLGTEVQFYLLFPLIAWAMQRRPILTYGLALAVGEGYRLWIHAAGLHNNFFWVCQLPGQIDLFVLGMLTAYAYVWLGERPHDQRVMRAATAIAVIAMACSAWLINDFSSITKNLGMPDHQAWQSDHRLIVSWTIALLALGSLFAASWWQRTIANPLLLFLSTISYNLYLWHEAVVLQCSRTGFPCAWVSNPWQVVRDWSFQYFWLYIGVSLGIATVITYAVERPFLRLRLRRGRALE